MVEHDFLVTYPYVVRVWPPADLMSRSAMASWLDRFVQWDKNLRIKAGGSDKPNVLHFTFRVQTLDDVALVKMRC